MKMKIYNFGILKLLCFGLLTVNMLHANEGDHVPVGSAVTVTDYQTNKQHRCELEQQEQEETQIIEDESHVSKAINVTTHLGAFHHPFAISLLGDVVELEDGSQWVVASYDRYKTLNWLVSDSVVITPNHAWFSSYDFVLNNQNTGDAIEINLLMGPIFLGVYSHWIVAIDSMNDQLILEDGSIWTVESLWWSKWDIGQYVIIGVNDGYKSNTLPNILINIATLDYKKANCIY
jgi:hypothetical protein